MNRAILIVICDFLVSAMLSMMTGMVPAHTGGTGVGLDEETTRALLADVEANRTALERMRERLRELVRRSGTATPEQERQLRELAARIVALDRKAELIKQGRDPKQLAKLSAEELQKRLEAELLRRRQAEFELREKRADLAATDRELSELRRDFAATGKAVAELTKQSALSQQELARSRQELAASRQQLSASQQQLAASQQQLSASQQQLAASRQQLSTSQQQLSTSQQQLSASQQQLTRSRQELSASQQQLATSRQQLSASRQELAASRQQLATSQQQLATSQQQLATSQQQLAASQQQLSASRQELTASQQQLEESRRELRRSESELADANTRLQSANAEIESERREVQRREADLADVRETLKEMNARLGQRTKESGTLRQTLAYTAGKLDSAEREAAEISGRLSRLEKTHSVTVLERDEALRKQAELARVVKSTVRELSQARKEAEESKVGRAEAVGRLTAVQAELKEAKRKLGNHVLECYGKGTMKLEVAVREERLMIDQRGGGTYYLPLVNLGGRKYLVGHFNQFAGNQKSKLVFKKVIQAALFMSIPGVKSPPGRPLAGPVMLARSELRAAAVPVPDIPGRTPIKALMFPELRSRGVKDLYLFKADTFGKESVELDGRCSLDVSSDVPYIFIRNSGSRSELKAEPGDLVLTREGDFAGIVVDNVSRGFGRGEEARAFVFADAKVWDSPRLIPYDKPRDARYFDAFSSAVRTVRDILDREERKRR